MVWQMISRGAVVVGGFNWQGRRCFEPNVAAIMVSLHTEDPAPSDLGFVQCPEAHPYHVSGVGPLGLNFEDFDAPFEQGLEDGHDLDFDASERWLAQG
jgi:hypothetical protein